MASGALRIDFRVLGAVEAAAGERVLELGGPRQRALLALLLLEPGRAVSAGRLADELWRGRPPAGAETTLRSYVSRLRRVVGRDAVAARAGGYVLLVDVEQVDARRFERLVREGREALARGAAGRAAERLRAALQLWRAPALADVSADGALAAEARRLDELRLVALQGRIEAELALGRHAELVPELQALVQQEPLREAFRRQLVVALYRSRRQADALAAYREARDLLAAEVGLEPSKELKELELAVLRHEIEEIAPVEARQNLPAPTTSFIGRGRELAEVEVLLRRHRLVAVTGIGGSGKTRLALEVARRQVEAWSDGVWLVDLTALSNPELVAGAVAEAVRGGEDGRYSLSALLDQLSSRELLLVLDNCEHLVAACAEIVQAVLMACPSVRALVTSRVSLGVPGEVDYALEPLEPVSAVDLFVERATAVRRDVLIEAEDLATVETICRDLDGLPLSIELAAARAKALSVAEIAARLDDRFRFLRAWQRVADPRHQALATTMEWSYGLLAPGEQELLRRLSVFAGGATGAAVAEVCCDGDDERALELLTRLVDASLVGVDAHGATRYRLLETVRQYASEKLAADGDVEEIRRRHAEYFLGLAEDANLALDSLGHGEQLHEPVLREQHNLRAALDWAGDADVELGLRLLLALENFWITYALVEGKRRFMELLERADDVGLVLRARAYRDYAGCLDVLQEFVPARAAYQRSRDLFEQAGDPVAVAYLDYRLGIVIKHLERDLPRARALWEASLETFKRANDPIGELQVLGDLGFFELRGGNVRRGREMVAASIAMARAAGWHWWEVQNSLKVAEVELDAGYVDEAERWVRGCLAACARMSAPQWVRYALAILARVAAARGDAERALTFFAAVEAVEDPPGRFGKFDRARLAAAMPDLPRPEPLPLDDAVAIALAG